MDVIKRTVFFPYLINWCFFLSSSIESSIYIFGSPSLFFLTRSQYFVSSSVFFSLSICCSFTGLSIFSSKCRDVGTQADIESKCSDTTTNTKKELFLNISHQIFGNDKTHLH